MGFFDKLFGNTTTPKFKTSEMLPEGHYWEIVARSQKAEDQDGQEAMLIKEIGRLTPKQIVGFRLRTDQLLHDTYTPEMWCAGYIMMGGCSDDAFEYFRCWVISNGKETYYAAKENPDSLVVFDGSDVDFDFESFWYVANEAFEKKTGNDLDDFIDEDNFITKEGNYPEMVFNWEEENPESMKKLCPKLYDKFWEE